MMSLLIGDFAVERPLEWDIVRKLCGHCTEAVWSVWWGELCLGVLWCALCVCVCLRACKN